ncbi:MAG: SpoIIE family protein phosphatase [Bacteroidia bacterium]
MEEVKATKHAIAGDTPNNQHFDTHEIKLKKGDAIYLFSDGYADLFNGVTGKKLMTKIFKQLLVDIQHQPMREREKSLNDFLEKWQNGSKQIDDILVIGVKL